MSPDELLGLVAGSFRRRTRHGAHDARAVEHANGLRRVQEELSVRAADPRKSTTALWRLLKAMLTRTTVIASELAKMRSRAPVVTVTTGAGKMCFASSHAADPDEHARRRESRCGTPAPEEAGSHDDGKVHE